MLQEQAPGPRGAKASWWQNLEGLRPSHAALTLHVPCPPDGIVEPDLVSPLELQALEILPLRRHQLPTERYNEEGKLSGFSENGMKSRSASQSFQASKLWINPCKPQARLDRVHKAL